MMSRQYLQIFLFVQERQSFCILRAAQFPPSIFCSYIIISILKQTLYQYIVLQNQIREEIFSHNIIDPEEAKKNEKKLQFIPFLAEKHKRETVFDNFRCALQKEFSCFTCQDCFYCLLFDFFAQFTQLLFLKQTLNSSDIYFYYIQFIMDIKTEGQQAITRIIEIREFFPKAGTISAKEQYAQEFKASIIKLVRYLKVENNGAIVKQLKEKLPGLEEELKAMRSQIQEVKKKKKFEEQSNKPKPKSDVRTGESELNANISQAIVREKPDVKWDDVGGLDQAKKVLQEAVILPTKFPEVFVGQRTPWKGILLYGPPGTGKTFLAKACATEMQGGTFFSVSSSDLMSKYVGEAEKTLRALFEVARKERPSIIFIDEIDSIAGERSSEENEVSRRVKTEFLVQMQGVGNDCQDVLVLGATNLPWAIDSAVRRRFQKRVYIPLPDIKGRLAMLKKVIQKNNINMTPNELNDLAKVTEGYSGSDIANMSNDALMAPVRNLNKTKTWVEVIDQGKVKYAPYDENLPEDPNHKYFHGLVDELKAKGHTIYLTTKYSDFIKALKSSKPSVSQGDLHKYIEWTKTFGIDG